MSVRVVGQRGVGDVEPTGSHVTRHSPVILDVHHHLCGGKEEEGRGREEDGDEEGEGRGGEAYTCCMNF